MYIITGLQACGSVTKNCQGTKLAETFHTLSNLESINRRKVKLITADTTVMKKKG